MLRSLGDELHKPRIPSLPKSVPPVRRNVARPTVEPTGNGTVEPEVDGSAKTLTNGMDGVSTSMPTSTPIAVPSTYRTPASAFSGPRSMIQQMAAGLSSASAGVQKPAWLVKQAARSLLQRPNAATLPPANVPALPSSAPLPRKQYAFRNAV